MREQYIGEEPDDFDLKRAFGYDDAQLLRQFEEAEEEADPDAPIPGGGFEAVMQKLRDTDTGPSQDAGIKPVAQNFAARETGRPRGRMRFTKKLVRSLLVAAILCSLVMAWGINAIGKKSYNYQDFTGGNPAGKMVWNNDENLVALDSQDEVYQQVKSVMGKSAMQLMYIPKEAELIGYDINERHANIKFLYSGKIIEFRQTKYDVGNSNTVVSDRTYYKLVHNDMLGKDIKIEKADLPDGNIEYSVECNVNDCHYYLYAQIEKEIFEDIVMGMNFIK